MISYGNRASALVHRPGEPVQTFGQRWEAVSMSQDAPRVPRDTRSERKAWKRVSQRLQRVWPCGAGLDPGLSAQSQPQGAGGACQRRTTRLEESGPCLVKSASPPAGMGAPPSPSGRPHVSTASGYATATATPNLTLVWDLHHSSQQHGSLTH